MAVQEKDKIGNASTGKEVRHGPGVTFGAQEKLPKLPIPKLEDTIRKYIGVLQPLQNRREQAETAAVAEEFLRRDGPELDARLRKYATGKTSYIEQFCMHLAYHQHGTTAESESRVRFIFKFRQSCRPESQPFLSAGG